MLGTSSLELLELVPLLQLPGRQMQPPLTVSCSPGEPRGCTSSVVRDAQPGELWLHCVWLLLWSALFEDGCGGSTSGQDGDLPDACRKEHRALEKQPLGLWPRSP